LLFFRLQQRRLYGFCSSGILRRVTGRQLPNDALHYPRRKEPSVADLPWS